MAESIVCDNKCQEAAKKYCRQCHKFLCAKCLQVHKDWKDFSLHEIVETHDMTHSLLESLKSDVQLNCLIHNKPLDYYCDECTVLCLDCTVGHHHYNKPRPIIDAFKGHKEHVERALSEMKEKLEAVQKARATLIDRVDAVTKSKESACKNVLRHAQEIVESVNKARDELVAQVKNSTEQKLHALGQIQDKADLAYVKMKSCEEHIQNRLKGSKVSVLMDKAEMVQAMADICNQVDHDMLQPTEEANLSFVEDREIIERCRSIGQIEFVSITNLTPNAPLSRFIPGTVTVQTQTLQHAPYNVELSASLITSGVNKLVNVDGEAAGEYTVRFTPLTQQDKLQLMANNVNIRGSPFPLEVTSRNNTLHNIAGLTNPSGLAVDSDTQSLVVAETGDNPCLTFFNCNREKIRSIESQQFINPCGVMFARGGHLVVSGHHRVQKVTIEEGQCISCIGDVIPGNGEELLSIWACHASRDRSDTSGGFR